MSDYTEDHLIEQPAIQLMEHELGWDSVNAYDEWASGASNLGREAKREVVLTGRLKPALQSLNPDLPAEALDAAVEALTRDRSALSLVEANREIDTLLRGTCEKSRLLDLLENYCRFSESKGAVGKLVARNHRQVENEESGGAAVAGADRAETGQHDPSECEPLRLSRPVSENDRGL